MFEEYFVPLFLVDCMRKGIVGKTRFQKLVYLIQKRTKERGIELQYNYEPYLHGPFSTNLNSIVEQLVAQGYLEETLEESSSGNSIYVYSMTSAGAKMIKDAQHKNMLPHEIVAIITNISQDYGYLPISELLEKVYREAGLI